MKTLSSIAGVALAPSQEVASECLSSFLDSPEGRCFVLSGYAGTGKTFLVGELVKQCLGGWSN